MRRAALKLEAVWWLSRLYLNNPPIWMALAGWLAATGGRIGDPARFALLMAFVVLAASAVMIQNDVMDLEADRVTAPYLPLPAGLLSRRAGAWWGAACTAAGLVALALAARTPARFAVCAGLLCVSAAATGLYSRLKHAGLAASLLIGLPFVVSPLIAWVVGGGGHAPEAALCAAYGYVFGLSANIQAALRDVDLDPLVGNRTFAVRAGARTAFALAAALALADFAPVAAVIALGRQAWAVPVAAAALGVMAWSLPRTARTFGEPGRGRARRVADMRAFKLGEFLRHAALACALGPLPGLVAAAVLQAMLTIGQRGYRRRVIESRLARSMEVVGAASIPDAP